MKAPAHHEPDNSAPLAPLHAASAVTLIAMDWLTYGANLLLGGHSLLLTTLAGSGLCALVVGLMERVREPPSFARAPEGALRPHAPPGDQEATGEDGQVDRARDLALRLVRSVATQKGLVAGAAVAMPLPLVGSVMGGIALVWALLVSTAGPKRARRR
jgi:hypothetical protein